MVYVISKDNEPLMLVKRFGKVRRWLKVGQARVVNRKPFTVQLLFETTKHVHPITLGIDSGYENIGFSAVTEKEELIGGEATLLRGMSERIKEKRMYRTQKRNRLRHRACRIDNRKRKDGWHDSIYPAQAGESCSIRREN